MDIIKFPEKENDKSEKVSGLYTSLYNVIADHVSENATTTASLIGVIEILKADIMQGIIEGE